ncbi:MAG TPA: type II/IV secretion system ATPase subunit [Dehalococcoidia bacterium]|nr:type II/IV secretion system ATPase subunit [Dehalococcoidia bacterium]
MSEAVSTLSNERGRPGSRGDVFARLQPALREAAEQAPHLRAYLEGLAFEEIGEPAYFPEISRKNKPSGSLNLIYAAGHGLYVHILNDSLDARDHYVSIDPSFLEDLAHLVALIEPFLLDYVDELEAAETEEEKKEILLQAVEDHVRITRGGSEARKRGDHVEVTPQEMEGLKYLIVRDKIGTGMLEPLLHDPHIEDISCSGLGQVYIEHKLFGALKSNIRWDDMAELDAFVLRLSEKIKKPVTFRNPISDATLPDGSRINIVYGGDVSTRGSNFTIRKFTAVPLSILDIIESGGINYDMAAYLWLMVGEGMNFFVSGETASGKTTLLNALTCFYEPAGKIVTIEDTPELQVPHPNWIREVVRGSMSGDDSSVTMFTLLKSALRQRPNAIIVGEIRGEEGAIAFQAMQTGHAVAATFHASTVEKLIQRLTGHPINVPKVYVDNLNLVVICSSVRLPTGKPGRRVLSVSEIIDYDTKSDSFSFVEIFRWNSATDVFEFTGDGNSYLLEQAVAPKRGLDSRNKRAIYEELSKRSNLIRKLHQTGRTDFFDLYKTFAQAERQGLI